jgi:hypothetical protein
MRMMKPGWEDSPARLSFPDPPRPQWTSHSHGRKESVPCRGGECSSDRSSISATAAADATTRHQDGPGPRMAPCSPSPHPTCGGGHLKAAPAPNSARPPRAPLRFRGAFRGGSTPLAGRCVLSYPCASEAPRRPRPGLSTPRTPWPHFLLSISRNGGISPRS